jgi:hypothetical protein
MPAPNPDLALLVGSWRLLSVERTFTDTGERSEVFGSAPSGRMVFASTGRVTFLIMRGDRQQPTNDAERSALYTNMISYSGTVRLGGPGRIITTVDVSVFPSEIGVEYLRGFSVDGDHLTITLPEQVEPRFSPGGASISELTWVREQPLG